MEAGTIVAWEKQEGDRIEEGEVLAIIETDKSTMEMETPDEGYLAKIVLPTGSKDVPINQVIVNHTFTVYTSNSYHFPSENSFCNTNQDSSLKQLVLVYS